MMSHNNVLAACCTTNVASTVIMLHLHTAATAATVRSSERVSVTKTIFLKVISRGADQEI